MAKMVGYACSIRLPWVKKAIELLDYNLDEEAYKKELNEDFLYFFKAARKQAAFRRLVLLLSGNRNHIDISGIFQGLHDANTPHVTHVNTFIRNYLLPHLRRNDIIFQ